MGINCPRIAQDQAELLDYATGTLNAERTAVLTAHLEDCAACRRFVEEHGKVWSVLDSWDCPPVSAGFDQALYRRIAEDRPWWERVARPLLAHRAIAAAAAACLLITAGVVIEWNPKPTVPVKPDLAIVDVQPEQVERALDALDVLSEFSHKARADATASKL